MNADNNLYQLYQSIELENVILSYKGEFTSELLTALIHILEAKMEELGTDFRVRKRVFNVIIECFQNLYHHIDFYDFRNEKLEVRKPALIIVKYKDGDFIVNTGNYVMTKDVPKLEKRLSFINTLNKNELRELYLEQLNKGKISSQGNAGLGLIEIARKTKEKLIYNFVKKDSKISFFSLKVVVGN